MNITQIKDTFEDICLSHKQIQAFNYGEDFILNDIEQGRIIQSFLELPYSFNYDFNTSTKILQFGLLVLFPSVGVDGMTIDHSNISQAESISEAIILRFKKELRTTNILIESVNGISVRGVSDADLCGVRLDITVRVPVCNSSYIDQFN